MHALKSVIVGALATTVSATYFNGEALRREVLQARATLSSASVSTVARPYPTATASTNSSNVCDSALNVLTGLPTPTGALYSYLKTASTTLTDPCHLAIPSSIAPAFSKYESAVVSFYSAHQLQLNSALSACPNLTSLVPPVCSTTASTKIVKTIPPTTPTPTPTETRTATGSSTPSTSIISTGTTGGANEMREKNAVALLVVGVVAMLL